MMPASAADTHDAGTRALDQLAMQETLARYAWGFDENDMEMLADTFTADGTTDGKVRDSEQSWGPAAGREAIVAMLRASREGKTAQGRHTLHTFRYENQTPTTADVHCYILISSAQPAGITLSTAGWYRAAMVKEGDGIWRMADLTAVLDSTFL